MKRTLQKNADLSNVYTRLETFNLIHDSLELKQDIFTSNSAVNVEQLTCNVSSHKYGLIINRLRESGNGGIIKLDSSSLNSEACSIQYVTDTANWYVGAAFNGKFSWYTSGSNWGDKVKLDDKGSLEIGISNNGASTGLKIITESSSINGYTELTCENSYRSALNVFTSHYPQLLIRLNFADFMEFNGQNNVIRHYQPLSHSSDDRLKENVVLITNACETLYKLRPRIYDKKQT